MAKQQPQTHVDQLINPTVDDKKRQYTFYLDDAVYREFMEACKDRGLSGSKVVSALMKDFIAKYGAGTTGKK
jgi:hypothetical protein